MEAHKDYIATVQEVVAKRRLKGRQKILAEVILSSFAAAVQNPSNLTDSDKDLLLYNLLNNNLTANGFSFSPIKVNGRMLYTRKEFFNLPFYTLNIGNWWDGILYSTGSRPTPREDSFDGPNIAVEFWPHEVFSNSPGVVEKYNQVESPKGGNVHAVAYLRAGKLLKTILEMSRESHAHFPDNFKAKYFTRERSSLTAHLVVGLLGAANFSVAKR